MYDHNLAVLPLWLGEIKLQREFSGQRWMIDKTFVAGKLFLLLRGDGL